MKTSSNIEYKATLLLLATVALIALTLYWIDPRLIMGY